MASVGGEDLVQDAMEEVVIRAADASSLVEAPTGLVDVVSEMAEHHPQEIVDSAAAGAGTLLSGLSAVANVAKEVGRAAGQRAKAVVKDDLNEEANQMISDLAQSAAA